ncbi:tetratricopeptide repeat protein [candidate division WOR-3 bacterium]|nr:tetratricopeptide repeat protein [candidate division WOR-3 bacterium]
MELLLLAFVALLVVALYPVVRDVIRRRRSADPTYVQALQALLDGDRAAAEERLRETVAADTANVDAYVRLGDVLIDKGDVDRGLKLHENLALRRNLRPQEERKVYRALARDYLRTDRKVKAMSVLEEMLRDDPADIDSAARLLGLYLDTGSWEKAREVLKLAGRAGRAARAAALHAEFGRAAAAADPAAALTALNEALRLDKGCLAARVYLGDLQLAQGGAEAAVRTWTEVLDKWPERNALVRQRMERAFYELGRYDEITGLYERLLRRLPDDGGLALALAGIYSKMERPDDAVRLLQRAVRAGRADAGTRHALALLYLGRAEPDKAQALLAEQAAESGRDRACCRSCGGPLAESLLRCPACQTWQGAA